MELVIRVAQFLLGLSILIVLHEMGHFFFARLFKTRVEKFYLFFNPWFSIFKFKKGDTEYGLGWLPLGGYVKISGMIDESMDREQMKKPPQPYEFRSKKTWERLLIMLGGVLVNFVTALIIFSFVLFTWGEKKVENQNLPHGIAADSLAKSFGFEDGDIITSINGKKSVYYDDVFAELIIRRHGGVKVERDGQIVDIDINNDKKSRKLLKKGFMEQGSYFIGIKHLFYIDSLLPDNPALKSGLQKGDKIIGLAYAGDTVFTDGFFHPFSTELGKRKEKEISVFAERNKDTIAYSLVVTKEGTMGVESKIPVDYVSIEYDFLESFPAGIKKGFRQLGDYVLQFGLVFTKQGAKEIGGFGSIAKLYDVEWNWYRFWNMTALLSIILAFMNVLPIPALDGGHVLFLLFEMVTGRKPGDKFLERAQMVGLVLLIGLLVYANGMDILRGLGKLFGFEV